MHWGPWTVARDPGALRVVSAYIALRLTCPFVFLCLRINVGYPFTLFCFIDISTHIIIEIQMLQYSVWQRESDRGSVILYRDK